MVIIDADRPALHHESLTLASTVTPTVFTSAYVTAAGQYANKECKEAFCTLETANIRYTLDGTTPSTQIGHLLAANASLIIKHPADIKNFQAMKVSSDATLKVTYRY